MYMHGMPKKTATAERIDPGAQRARIAEEMTGCACLRLRKATRKVTAIYDAALAPAGLTCTQFSLLAYLHIQTDLSMAELAGRLAMDPTTLTRVLRPLEERGQVEILVSREDRRRRAVAVTALGRKTFAAAVPLWRQAQAELGTILGAGTLAGLMSALGRALVPLDAA